MNCAIAVGGPPKPKSTANDPSPWSDLQSAFFHLPRMKGSPLPVPFFRPVAVTSGVRPSGPCSVGKLGISFSNRPRLSVTACQMDTVSMSAKCRGLSRRSSPPSRLRPLVERKFAVRVRVTLCVRSPPLYRCEALALIEVAYLAMKKVKLLTIQMMLF